MSAARDGHGERMSREQLAEAFGVPLDAAPHPGTLHDQAAMLALAWRSLGREVAKALGLPAFVDRLARALERSDEARQRLRGMVERNATRHRLTVNRADLKLVLDELDAHRARLKAGGDQ